MIKRIIWAVLLCALIPGANASEFSPYKLDINNPKSFDIPRKVTGIVGRFNFMPDNLGNRISIFDMECSKYKCLIVLEYQGIVSEVINVDEEDDDTYWKSGIRFAEFAKKINAYIESDRNLFVVDEIYAHSIILRDFGESYEFISNCDLFNFCEEIRNTIMSSDLDINEYEEILDRIRDRKSVGGRRESSLIEALSTILEMGSI